MPIQQTQESTPSDQLALLMEFIYRAFRHFWKAFLVLLIGGGLSFVLAVKAKHTYSSEAVLLYRELIDSSFVTGQAMGPRQMLDLSQTLREQLLARPRLKKMIDKYGLYKNVVENRGYLEAEDMMRNFIKVSFGAGDSFRVSFIGNDPETVYQVTKELSEDLMEESVRLRSEQAQTAVRFLEKQRNDSETQLKRKEEERATFLAKNPEFAEDTGGGGSGSGASIRAKSLRPQRKGDPVLYALQSQMLRIQNKLANPESPTFVEDQAVVEEKRLALQEFHEAQQNLLRMRAQYTDQHPDVASSRTRLEAAVARLKKANSAAAAPKPVTTRLENNKVSELENQLNEVQQQIKTYKTKGSSKEVSAKSTEKANSIVALETTWSRLSREVEELRESYLRIEDRYFRANLKASSEGKGSAMQIIDPAYVPKHPISMSRSKILMLACGATFMLSMMVMFGLALIDNRIYTPRDVERMGVGKVLAVIPIQSRKDRKRAFKTMKMQETMAAMASGNKNLEPSDRP
jgi:hypothetical protein